jgi:hypothetical protein
LPRYLISVCFLLSVHPADCASHPGPRRQDIHQVSTVKGQSQENTTPKRYRGKTSIEPGTSYGTSSMIRKDERTKKPITDGKDLYMYSFTVETL